MAVRVHRPIRPVPNLSCRNQQIVAATATANVYHSVGRNLKRTIVQHVDVVSVARGVNTATESVAALAANIVFRLCLRQPTVSLRQIVGLAVVWKESLHLAERVSTAATESAFANATYKIRSARGALPLGGTGHRDLGTTRECAAQPICAQGPVRRLATIPQLHHA